MNSEIRNPKSEIKDTRLIREITLRNILSFGPDTPPFELKPLNVLIGANGSGKSNLIDCIGLMRATAVDEYELINQGRGPLELVHKKNPDSVAHFQVIMAVDSQIRFKHQLRFSCPSWSPSFFFDSEDIFRGLSDDPLNLIYHRTIGEGWLISQSGIKEKVPVGNTMLALANQFVLTSSVRLIPLFSRYKSIRIYRNWNFIDLRASQPIGARNDYFMEDMSNYKNRLAKLIATNPSFKKDILAHLHNLYNDINDINSQPIDNNIQIWLTESETGFSANRLSDGTLRYLCLLAILCDPEPPPLICIEEPELGLHPDVLPGLADLLVEASTRTQLIVTTHSDILVEAMTETPESVVVCEKHDGKTEMHRLTHGEVEPWLDKYRLGELWLRGGIGGKRW